ncbi:hypothetical protein [Streptomyces sp. NPDC051636]|uniref:hypothetical protein n=1 Tax=Streptomyces sp. NPDC051636 TaxID=3365663 RepID=UPI0037AA7A9D
MAELARSSAPAVPPRRVLFGVEVGLWAQRPGCTVSRLVRVLSTGQRMARKAPSS